MSLEKFIEYCEKNSQKETKDSSFEHRKFIDDIIKNPRIIKVFDVVKSFPNVVLYEEGRFGGRTETGVIDVILIDDNGGIYACMAKTCNRAGRGVKKKNELC